MSDNINMNQEPEKKIDKNSKPKFNSNWVFAIVLVALIAFQFMFTGNTIKSTDQKSIVQMVVNHDIDKVIIINKERAEIYLTTSCNRIRSLS